MRKRSIKERHYQRDNIYEMFDNDEDKEFKRYKQICYVYLLVKGIFFFIIGCLVSHFLF